MNYRIVYKDELYHYGVKGMKWGVRKADYNAPGMRSNSITTRLDSLENQEIRAYSENRSNYRAAKKQIRGGKKARIKEAKAANKEAQKAYSKSFDNAYSFSEKHPITTMFKKHENYKKNKENWADAISKAEAAKAAKQNLKDVKRTARADAKAGRKAAKEILRKNEDEIARDFDKAYYKTIGERHIQNAKRQNAALEIANIVIDKKLGNEHDNSYYEDTKSRLEYAEKRRNRYAERYNRG
jgi:hypothetical protein